MKTSDRKRILVTGGLGFLGSHLCNRLLQEDTHVVCVDNFSSGVRNNASHFIQDPYFEIIEHDITQPLHLNSIDEIYNLACPASPVHYQNNPIQTTKTSVLGVAHMLDLARITNAKIFQASTSEIYGEPEEHPQRESYIGRVNNLGVRSCYSEGKRCAETLFHNYHHQYNLQIKIARIFNTYGPYMRMNDGRVISNFIVQSLRGENITIYGDGSQTRSFCYVDDLIEGFMRLMATNSDLTGPLNLGNPTEITIKQLAETIILLVGSKSKLIFKPLPRDDPSRRQPDITLAKQMLNWEPKVDLEDGLKITIEYFKGILLK